MAQEDEYMKVIEQQQKEIDDIKQQAQIGGAQMIHQENQSSNLIQWQLDIESELELIERMLRGHKLKRDKDGNQVWTEPDDPEEALFNEKGVQEIMKLVRMYVNKNLLLSNFSEPQILQRVKQFGERLNRFIYLNYEDFGMDTPYKQKHFEMVVMNLTDMVEAAYMRALNGGERRSLREARTVSQSETLNPAPTGNQFSQRQSSSLNPLRLFKR